MKRSGGHRIPGLNCCGQGRMCYRWSKRYCWAGTGGDAHKNPHLSFSSKNSLGENLAFFTKATEFQVEGARRLFPASPFCVVDFFFCFGVHGRDMLLQRKSGIS